MLGVWIICNKHEHKLIAEKWLEVIKSTKSQHQLTLLYLCNDVIQKCTRKKAPVYKSAFGEVIPEAMTYIRKDVSIRKNVERVLNIWKKRSIYDSEFVDQLMATLLANRTPDILKNKLLAEYKTTELIDDITELNKLKERIDKKRVAIDNLKLSDTDIQKKLKDKAGGKCLLKDFEDERNQVNAFMQLYTQYQNLMERVNENLEKGKIYYRAQYHEAKPVANVYKSYAKRLIQTQEGLVKVVERLKQVQPSPPYVDDVPSPFDDDERMARSNDDMDISDDDQQSNPIRLMSGRNINEPILNIPPGLLAAATESITKSTVQQLLGFDKKSSSSPAASWKPTAYNNGGGGGQSPPSPVGSPELNIPGSPPRHQSLESRLADIFNNDGSAIIKQNISDDDAPPITAPPLPGLGELDKLKDNSAEEEYQPDDCYSIPVIGGSSSSTLASNKFQSRFKNGDHTPTQDEDNKTRSALSMLSSLLPPKGEQACENPSQQAVEDKESNSSAWLAAYSPPPADCDISDDWQNALKPLQTSSSVNSIGIDQQTPLLQQQTVNRQPQTGLRRNSDSNNLITVNIDNQAQQHRNAPLMTSETDVRPTNSTNGDNDSCNQQQQAGNMLVRMPSSDQSLPFLAPPPFGMDNEIQPNRPSMMSPRTPRAPYRPQQSNSSNSVMPRMLSPRQQRPQRGNRPHAPHHHHRPRRQFESPQQSEIKRFHMMSSNSNHQPQQQQKQHFPSPNRHQQRPTHHQRSQMRFRSPRYSLRAQTPNSSGGARPPPPPPRFRPRGSARPMRHGMFGP